MSDLLNKKCIPCEAGEIIPFSREEAEKYLTQLSGWILNEKATAISKEFKFKDFAEAMDFVKKVANIAEEEGHHPDIHIFYNKVLIELSTHAIKGLSKNDFILAAQIDVI